MVCKMANNVDPDQTASSLIWVYTICSGTFGPIFKVIMVGNSI